MVYKNNLWIIIRYIFYNLICVSICFFTNNYCFKRAENFQKLLIKKSFEVNQHSKYLVITCNNKDRLKQIIKLNLKIIYIKKNKDKYVVCAIPEGNQPRAVLNDGIVCSFIKTTL